MQGLAVAVLIIYGVLYGLFHLIMFLSSVFKKFRNYLKKIYHKYYTQKKYDKSLIGRAEITHQLILAKIKEINIAIDALKADLAIHQKFIESQRTKLKKDQYSGIKKAMTHVIKVKTQKTKVIEGYIKLFTKFLAPMYKKRNGMEALLEIIRFDQQTGNTESYSEQFEDLTAEINFYSRYDFVSISDEIILHLNSSIEDIEITSAERYLYEKEQEQDLSSDPSNVLDRLSLNVIPESKLRDLETLILRDFENSLAEFEAVKADFKRVFKR